MDRSASRPVKISSYRWATLLARCTRHEREPGPPGPASPAATDRPAAVPRRRPTTAGIPPPSAAPCGLAQSILPWSRSAWRPPDTPSAMASKMALLSPSLRAGMGEDVGVDQQILRVGHLAEKTHPLGHLQLGRQGLQSRPLRTAAGNPQLERFSRAGQQGRRLQQHVVRLAGNQRPDGDDPRTSPPRSPGLALPGAWRRYCGRLRCAAADAGRGRKDLQVALRIAHHGVGVLQGVAEQARNAAPAGRSWNRRSSRRGRRRPAAVRRRRQTQRA